MKQPQSSVAFTTSGPVEYCYEGSSGPILVGLHGTPGAYTQMISIMTRLELTPDRCRRLTISRPGYSRTPLASGEFMPAQADLLAALLDYLDIPCVDAILAFSGGGIPGLEFARSYPQRVKSLILLSAVADKYYMFGGNFLKKLIMRMLYSSIGIYFSVIMSYVKPSMVIKSMIAQMSSFDKDRLNAEVRQVMKNPADKAFFLELLRLNVRFSTLKQGVWNDDVQIKKADVTRYRKLNMPMLILHSKFDGDVPFSHAENLHEMLPHSSLSLVDNAYHLLIVEPHLPGLKKLILDFCGLPTSR